MLNKLSNYSGLFNEEYQILVLAIIFHDVIYEVGSKTNETNSAVIFKNMAESLDTFKPKFIEAVYNIIIVTSNHEEYKFLNYNYDMKMLSEIMIELDLSGFDDDDYFEIDSSVVKEFKPFFKNWEEFKEAKLKFLVSYIPKIPSKEGKINAQKLIDFYTTATEFHV